MNFHSYDFSLLTPKDSFRLKSKTSFVMGSHLLSTYYVPDTVLNYEDAALNKAPTPAKCTFKEGRQPTKVSEDNFKWKKNAMKRTRHNKGGWLVTWA